MKKREGFTLIEVLIVVVIIGVLAALVIPRFLTAPEKAIVAEANQMLGTIVRAQQLRADTGVAYITASPFTSVQWTGLGMKEPASASKFVYSCTSPTCSAARTPSGGSASTITFSMATNTWACTTSYTPLTNGGCTLVA